MAHRQLHVQPVVKPISAGRLAPGEYAKDSWNADNLPGVRHLDTSSNRWIHFEAIPHPFRPLVKQWCRFLLTGRGQAFTTCNEHVYYLQVFLIWLVERYPTITTFAQLTTTDIEKYLASCRAAPNARGTKRSDTQIWKHLHVVKTFLEYLEFNQHPLRTQEPVQKILGPQRIPSPLTGYAKTQQIKYIPASVLAQFDQHIQDLLPRYIPLAILLRATGWRISDVLLLKMETCLERTEKGGWICGDIAKTKVLGHKVPITAEVALVVETLRAWVKEHYPSRINPKGYLFPASYCTRKQQGKPLTPRGVNIALNRLASKYAIRAEDGSVFHFHTHAFRHTKAVELINNGMSLVMVQQWMAHASPEMTLIYAKILDETMRKQWEETVKQGAVWMGPEGGTPQMVEGKRVLTVLNNNALDVERVREHRLAVKLPIGNCCKTSKIICRFVELPCFQCPAYVLTPEDLPALESYAEQVSQRIEIGRQAGQKHWVEANQGLLEQKVLPSIELLRQGQTIAKEDKYVREYTPEEWAKRQATDQQEQES